MADTIGHRMKPRQRTPAPSKTAGWAPRLQQEARLAELETAIARGGEGGITLEVERAALLGALNRREEALAAFIAILRKAPTHFSALNEFGALLTSMGSIDALSRKWLAALMAISGPIPLGSPSVMAMRMRVSPSPVM